MNRLSFDWFSGALSSILGIIAVVGAASAVFILGATVSAHDDAAAACGKTEVVYAVWDRLTPEAKERLQSPQHVADLMYGGTLKLKER